MPRATLAQRAMIDLCPELLLDLGLVEHLRVRIAERIPLVLPRPEIIKL